MPNRVRHFSAALIYLIIVLYAECAYPFTIGVGLHSDAFNGNPSELIDLMKKYKIQSLRTDYQWSNVEKKKGEYKAPNNNTEGVLQIARENGIESIVILDYGNKIYGFKKPLTTDEVESFSKYAAWTARHFKDKVTIYEVWNEWSNRSSPGADSEDSAIKYVTLVKSVSEAVKKEDPKAIIIAGSFNPTDAIDLKWGKNLVRHGVLNYVDGLSIHPYSYWTKKSSNPDLNIRSIDKAQREIMAISKRKNEIPFYITEVGIPTTDKKPIYTQQEVASYATDFIKLARQREYIKGVWWYDLIDDGSDRNNKEHNFGLLTQDLKEKKAITAIKESLSSTSDAL